MYRRNLTGALVAALSDTPAVFLHGPRQARKSTLAQSIAGGDHPARYLSLDDAAVLSAAKADPQGFVSDLSRSMSMPQTTLKRCIFPSGSTLCRFRHCGTGRGAIARSTTQT